MLSQCMFLHLHRHCSLKSLDRLRRFGGSYLAVFCLGVGTRFKIFGAEKNSPSLGAPRKYRGVPGASRNKRGVR